MAFGRASKVVSSWQVQSVLFDFAKISPTGIPIPQGTVIDMGMKLPPGLLIATTKQGIINITSTNPAATIQFVFGVTPVANVTNANYAGDQYLVTAVGNPVGGLTIVIGGGAGNITAGKFIYSFYYNSQQVR